MLRIVKMADGSEREVWDHIPNFTRTVWFRVGGALWSIFFFTLALLHALALS